MTHVVRTCLEFVLDGRGYPPVEAIQRAATVLIEQGYRPSVAIVPPFFLMELLAAMGPTSGSAHSSFPAVGLFVQTVSGWIHVSPDQRLDEDAWVRDAAIGASCRLRVKW